MAGEGSGQPSTSTWPVSTRRPDDAGLPSASSSVTANAVKVRGETPDHRVTAVGSLNVPTLTRMPSGLRSQAS